MDYSPPGSSVHGSLQARRLQWVAISSSRGSSRPRDRTQVSCVSALAGGFFTTEPLESLFRVQFSPSHASLGPLSPPSGHAGTPEPPGSVQRCPPSGLRAHSSPAAWKLPLLTCQLLTQELLSSLEAQEGPWGMVSHLVSLEDKRFRGPGGDSSLSLRHLHPLRPVLRKHER